jgi:hypothetical protein
MIDRILFYIYFNDLFNKNQYGFTPQRGTIDATMEVKKFIEERLRLKQCTIIDGPDVNGAFGSALLKDAEEPARDSFEWGITVATGVLINL